eukprot:COSAG01_NODE_2679_length_7257_cov_144.510056_1_plen_32_part_10
MDRGGEGQGGGVGGPWLAMHRPLCDYQLFVEP